MPETPLEIAIVGRPEGDDETAAGRLRDELDHASSSPARLHKLTARLTAVGCGPATPPFFTSLGIGA